MCLNGWLYNIISMNWTPSIHSFSHDENRDDGEDILKISIWIKLLCYYYDYHSWQTMNFFLSFIIHRFIMLSFQLLIIKSLCSCIADASIAKFVGCEWCEREMRVWGGKKRKQKFVLLLLVVLWMWHGK